MYHNVDDHVNVDGGIDDDGDADDDYYDDDDDDDEERKMMMWMLRRRRKRMVLRRMMLRRKADPKTRESHFVRACTVEMRMDMSQELFCVETHRESIHPRHRISLAPGSCAGCAFHFPALTTDGWWDCGKMETCQGCKLDVQKPRTGTYEDGQWTGSHQRESAIWFPF